MKARIQLCKSDNTDSTLFSSDGKMYNILSPIGNIQDGINCEMLIVIKTDNYIPGDYYLIREPDNTFIVEQLARISQINTVGIREMFIGYNGTVAALDNVEAIIATSYSDKFKELPRPHGVFICKYIKEYNEGRKITDIDVETYANDPHKKVKILDNGTIVIKPWNKNIVEHSDSMRNSIDPELLKFDFDHITESPDFDKMFREIMKKIDANEKEQKDKPESEKTDSNLFNAIYDECVNKGYTFDQFMDMLEIESIENEREKAELEHQLEVEKAAMNKLIIERELKSWASLLDGPYHEIVPEPNAYTDNTIKALDDNISLNLIIDIPGYSEIDIHIYYQPKVGIK